VLPPFDLQGGAMLAAARDASVTALLSAFGATTFRVIVAPKAFAAMEPNLVTVSKRRLLLLALLSVAACLAGTLVWLVAQAAYMADAESLYEAFGAVPKVLAKTTFGHVVISQLAALFGWAGLLGWRDRPARPTAALCVATLAVALESGHSHAFSMVPGPSLLLACDILHLLAAGAWLGGLIPLLMLVRMAPPKAGAVAARWFSPLGQWCLAALVATAAFQGWVLVASIPGLVGTAYGWMVLVKLALFGTLFCFACANRYRFAPALLRDDAESARRVLVRSISVQTGFALAIVVAAVVLSELPPAMHLQALWPFAKRFSVSAVNEDPDFRREVLYATTALAAAAALLILTLIVRRFRIAASIVAAAVAWFALPHLDLLLVQAYPTSFYHSPTRFSSASIVTGSTLFAQNCVACHGANGSGDGPLAKQLAEPPADLTAAHLWMHSDGELFWWISHGMFAPEGGQVMPGFAATLDDDSRWALIDYIRAHNAGNASHQSGEWPRPVRAADFGVQCNGRDLKLSDLRGHFVRLSFGVTPPAAASVNGLKTIVAQPPAGALPAGVCTARDETVPMAYAILSGAAPGAITGTQFLIDPNGWLRAMQAGNSPPTWNNPMILAAEIKTLEAHKVTASAPAEPMKMPMNMPM
jgi:putative copper export protein/mono/diheme cytochrome c family protein